MPPRNFADDGAAGANSNGNFGQPSASSFHNDGGSFGAPHSGGGGFAPLTAKSGGGYWGVDNAAGLNFAEGGAIPDGDDDDADPNATDPQGSKMGAAMQRSINDAMSTVKDILSYGRSLHGLGGGQQEAAAMPTIPGNQSESGRPAQRPVPGPQTPQFGKRADAAIDDEGSDKTAAMPSVPFSETPKPQPMPGPLPPTSNPFGKRGAQTSDAGEDAAPAAIDTEEDA